MRYRKYAALAAVLGCLVAGANASVWTWGFEAPDYGDGDTLTGSNGWTAIEGTDPVGSITGSIAATGEQSAVLTRNALSPATYGAWIQHSGIIPTQQNPVVTVEWDMYALDSSNQSDMWGVSAYNHTVERMTVGINQDNKLTMRNAMIGTVVTNVNVARNTWNHYRMDLRYDMNMAAIYFNNNFIGEWATNNGPVEHVGTALFNRGFGSTDGAAFDNVSVSAVPEPASLAIAGIGFAGLAARRRRKK